METNFDFQKPLFFKTIILLVKWTEFIVVYYFVCDAVLVRFSGNFLMLFFLGTNIFSQIFFQNRFSSKIPVGFSLYFVES